MANDTLDPANPIEKYSFLANAPSGSPLSYQSLLTRRKIAEALMSKRERLPFPKNPGEGIAYASEKLANAFDDRTTLDRLDAAERARQAELDKLAAGPIPGAGIVPGTPAATGAAGAGEDTSAATGVPPVPYVPSGPGSVPLPQQRPVVDRSALQGDPNDPVMARRLAAITLGEGNERASEGELRTQYATPIDRSLATSTSLEDATRTGPGGYYPAEAIARGERMLQRPGAYESFQERIAKPVLRGADPGRKELNLPFTPTQNASLGVADRGVASGRYSQSGRSPTGELFARKPGEAQPTPFSRGGPDTDPGNTGPDIAQASGAAPGSRDAIAATMMPEPPPSPPVFGRRAGLRIPLNSFGLPQMASLGGGGPLGNAGAASSVIPPVLPPTPPAGNPPIVTSQITPRPVPASGGIPGPLTPPTPTPEPPPAPGTPQGFQPQPSAPVLDTRPTLEEIYGTRLMRSHPDDPAYAAEAQRWLAAGAAKRQAAFEQQKEIYKNKMEAWKLERTAWIAQQNPEAQLRLREAEEKARREKADYEHFGGQTLEQAKAPVVESYKEARKIPSLAIEIASAKELVPQMFTGSTANIDLSVKKLAHAMGWPLDPRVPAAEAFKSHIQGVVAALRPMVEGTGTQSNVELSFLQKAAGADATLDAESITKILASVEKLNTLAAIEHQKKVLTFTGSDENRQRAFGGFNIAMEHVIPQQQINILRDRYEKNPTPETLKEFDDHYYTPGLANKILAGRR